MDQIRDHRGGVLAGHHRRHRIAQGVRERRDQTRLREQIRQQPADQRTHTGHHTLRGQQSGHRSTDRITHDRGDGITAQEAGHHRRHGLRRVILHLGVGAQGEDQHRHLIPQRIPQRRIAQKAVERISGEGPQPGLDRNTGLKGLDQIRDHRGGVLAGHQRRYRPTHRIGHRRHQTRLREQIGQQPADHRGHTGHHPLRGQQSGHRGTDRITHDRGNRITAQETGHQRRHGLRRVILHNSIGAQGDGQLRNLRPQGVPQCQITQQCAQCVRRERPEARLNRSTGLKGLDQIVDHRGGVLAGHQRRHRPTHRVGDGREQTGLSEQVRYQPADHRSQVRHHARGRQKTGHRRADRVTNDGSHRITDQQAGHQIRHGLRRELLHLGVGTQIGDQTGNTVAQRSPQCRITEQTAQRVGGEVPETILDHSTGLKGLDQIRDHQGGVLAGHQRLRRHAHRIGHRRHQTGLPEQVRQ